MLRVGTDGADRLRGRLEQDVVDDGLVLQGDGGDGRRQGKDNVEVGNRQELGTPVGEPLDARQPLAFWAVPVATGNGRRPLAALWANSVMGSWRGDVGIFQ